MAVTNDIIGKYVNIHVADSEDAFFTLNIRKSDDIKSFIPQLDISIEEQIAWINNQRESEDSYFFVAQSKKGDRIGTLSIYDLNTEFPQSGRLVLKGNPVENMEAQYLTFNFVFEVLNLKKIYGYIYENNERAIRFSKQFGSIIEGTTFKSGKNSLLSTLTSEDFFGSKARKLLYRD